MRIKCFVVGLCVMLLTSCVPAGAPGASNSESTLLSSQPILSAPPLPSSSADPSKDDPLRTDDPTTAIDLTDLLHENYVEQFFNQAVSDPEKLEQWVDSYKNRTANQIDVLFYDFMMGKPYYLLRLVCDNTNYYTATLVFRDGTEATAKSSRIIKREYDIIFASDTPKGDWNSTWQFAAVSHAAWENVECIEYDGNHPLGILTPEAAIDLVVKRVYQFYDFTSGYSGPFNDRYYFPLDNDDYATFGEVNAHIEGALKIDDRLCYLVNLKIEPYYIADRYVVTADGSNLIWVCSQTSADLLFRADGGQIIIR